MERRCGACAVCCEVADVEGLDFPKPAGTRCPHALRGCAIHADPKRPMVCRSFRCAWLQGFGRLRDRPDKCGCMVTVNDANGGRWIFAVDVTEGAHRTTGAGVIRAVSDAVRLPVVVVLNEHLILGKGDFVMLREDQESRAGKIKGAFVERVNGLNKYVLVVA